MITTASVNAAIAKVNPSLRPDAASNGNTVKAVVDCRTRKADADYHDDWTCNNGRENVLIRSEPIKYTISEKIRYTRPAAMMPPCAYSMPFVSTAALTAAINANEEPTNTGTLNFVQQWKIIVPIPAVTKRHRRVKARQERHEHSRAEHRKQMLDAERVVLPVSFCFCIYDPSTLLF